MSSVIYYTDSYKYRVNKTFEVELTNCPVIPYLKKGGNISTAFTDISMRYGACYLTLFKDYGWDGATWALDSRNFRRGSACHDALLEIIGLGFLPADPWKLWTDNFLIQLCKEDKMWWPRRKWVYRAVRALGDPTGSKPREVYSAP